MSNNQEILYDSEPQKSLAKELDALNVEWEKVTAHRRKWMDEHMQYFAKYKVGETIYEFPSGRKLGVITKLYRYWGKSGRDPQYDYSMNVEYEYHTGNNCYDNTSRRSVSICNEKELEDWYKFKAKSFEDVFD